MNHDEAIRDFDEWVTQERRKLEAAEKLARCSGYDDRAEAYTGPHPSHRPLDDYC